MAQHGSRTSISMMYVYDQAPLIWGHLHRSSRKVLLGIRSVARRAGTTLQLAFDVVRDHAGHQDNKRSITMIKRMGRSIKHFAISLCKVSLYSHAENFKHSGELLEHYVGIFDHIVKIITTVALLVALELFRRKSSANFALILEFAVGVFLLFYLQRLVEHCILFFMDKWDCDVSGTRARWGIGSAIFVLTATYIFFAPNAIQSLADLKFLNPD